MRDYVKCKWGIQESYQVTETVETTSCADRSSWWLYLSPVAFGANELCRATYNDKVDVIYYSFTRCFHHFRGFFAFLFFVIV